MAKPIAEPERGYYLLNTDGATCDADPASR